MDVLRPRISSGNRWIAAIFFADRLLYGRTAVHKFGPLEVVPDEVIKGRCCNFNPCTVCELDRHSRLLRVMKFAKLSSR